MLGKYMYQRYRRGNNVSKWVEEIYHLIYTIGCLTVLSPYFEIIPSCDILVSSTAGTTMLSCYSNHLSIRVQVYNHSSEKVYLNLRLKNFKIRNEIFSVN